MAEKLICLLCPMSCELLVSGTAEDFTVSGNACSRGRDFAEEEVFSPLRNIATSIPIDGRIFRMLSVRLSERIPRAKIPKVLSLIAKIRVSATVSRGEILYKGIADTKADLIATRTVD